VRGAAISPPRTIFETGDALPGQVMGYVSVRPQGGSSCAGPHDLKDIKRFYGTPADVERCRQACAQAGLHLIAESRLGMALAGPPAAWERLTRGRLVTYERRMRARAGSIRSVTHLDIVGARQPEEAGVARAPETEAIEFIVLEHPRPLHAVGPESVPPPIDRQHLRVPDDVATILRAVAAHRDGHRGAGAKVAMVDSGWWAHPFFATHGYRVAAPITVVPGTKPREDPIGHGTGESANLFAVAPDAELWPVRASNANGDLVGAVAGFMAAKQARPDVLTNSWGGDCDPVPDEPGKANLAFALEIRDAVLQGIVVVFSAGNGSLGVEAQVEGVIAAGGVFPEGGRLEASPYASGYASPWFADVEVPTVSGVVGIPPRASLILLPVPPGCRIDLERAFPAGGDAADGTTPFDGWALFSGTSAAAPQVAGAAAVLRAIDRRLTPADVAQVLRETAVDIRVGRCHPRFNHAAEPGRDLATGDGLVDVAAAAATVAESCELPTNGSPVEQSPDVLTSLTLSLNKALDLVRRLATDDDFRTAYLRDPEAALKAVGIDPEECPSENINLAPKEEFQRLLDALRDDGERFRTLFFYLSS
jgi:putative modified peptide